MEKLLYLLLAACVFFMNTQHGLKIPIGKNAIHLGIVDVLLPLTFALMLLWATMQKRLLRLKLPPVAVWALPAAALVVAVVAGQMKASAGGVETAVGRAAVLKEILQLVMYFVIGWMLFVNIGRNRTRLRGLISVFLFAAGAAVLWGLIEYAAKGDVFTAGGPHANINVLGAYFAIVLPFVAGIALFDRQSALQRLSLVVPVVVGAAITLSMPALLVTAASLLLVLAMRSTKLLFAGILLLLIVILVLPGSLRRNHVDILTSSVAVYVDNNHLLSDERLMERAQKLLAEKRYGDARQLLLQLDGADRLNDEGVKLLDEATRSATPEEKARPVQVAARYRCWQAALRALRATPKDRPCAAVAEKTKEQPRKQAASKKPPARPQYASLFLRGAGVGWFKKAIGQYYGTMPKPTHNTDEVEAYNINCDQPDTFGQLFVTTVELGVLGLLALVWFYLWGMGRAIRLFAGAQSPLSRGVAAGVIGSLAFMPILALYSELLVRGVALPLVFIIACVYILERSEKEPA